MATEVNFTRRLIYFTFCALLAARFWTEYLDQKLGLPFSQLVTVSTIGLAFFIGLMTRLKLSQRTSRLAFWWVVFLLANVLSLSFNVVFLNKDIQASEALVQISKFVLYFCVFFLTCELVRSKEDLNGIFYSLIFGAIPSMGLAIVQGLTGGGFQEIRVEGSMMRAIGMSTHPVLFGILLVLVASLVIFLRHWITIKSSGKLLLYVFFALLLGALYYTYARTAWVMCLFIGLIVAFGVGSLRLRVWTIVFLVVCSAAAPFLFASRFSDLANLIPFIMDAEFARPDYYNYIESSVHWRIFNWYDLLTKFIGSWVIGYGPGQAPYVGFFGRPSHSSIVDVMVEQGLVGLLSFLMVVRLIYSDLTRKIKRYYRLDKAFMFLPKAVYISFLVSMAFSVSFINQTMNMTVLVIMLALVYISDRYADPADAGRSAAPSFGINMATLK